MDSCAKADFERELHRAVTDIIRRVDAALSVADAIADCRDQINGSPYRDLFDQIQMAEIDAAVLVY